MRLPSDNTHVTKTLTWLKQISSFNLVWNFDLSIRFQFCIAGIQLFKILNRKLKLLIKSLKGVKIFRFFKTSQFESAADLKKKFLASSTNPFRSSIFNFFKRPLTVFNGRVWFQSFQTSTVTNTAMVNKTGKGDNAVNCRLCSKERDLT